MPQEKGKPVVLPPIEVNAYREQTYWRLGVGAGYDLSPLHPRSRIPGYVERLIAGAVDWVIDTTESSKASFSAEYTDQIQRLPENIQSEIETTLATLEAAPDFSLAASIKRELTAVQLLIDQRNLTLPSLQVQANAFFSGDPLDKSRQDFINTISQRDLDVTPIQEIHDIYPAWATSYSAAYSVKLVTEALRLLHQRVAELTAQHAAAVIQQEAEAQKRRDEEQRLKAEQESAQASIRAQNTFSAPGAVAMARPFIIGAAGIVGEVGTAALALSAAISTAIAQLIEIAKAGPGAYIATFATLMLYSPKLGSADRFAISVPLADLDPSIGGSGPTNTGELISLPVRIGINLKDRKQDFFLAATGKNGASPSVRSVTAQWNPKTGTYDLSTTDNPARHLTWTPITQPGNSSTERPTTSIDTPVYPGAEITPTQPQVETFPAIVDLNFDDYIIWFPADSGLKPIYVVFNSPYDGATTTGEHSGRDFNPDQAGGPIVDLDWRTAVITQEGIDAVRLHIARLDQSDANDIMIERLEKILKGDLDITDTDRRYYTHELRELERFRTMGIKDDFKPQNGSPAWNNAHTATLEDYKLNGDEKLLYSNEAIHAADKQIDRIYEQLLKGVFK